jgi:exonuclease III
MDILFQTYSPAVLCLQETLQNEKNLINFRHYTQYHKYSTKSDGTPGGDVAILVRNCIPHSQIPLNTALQATAIRITLHKNNNSVLSVSTS